MTNSTSLMPAGSCLLKQDDVLEGRASIVEFFCDEACGWENCMGKEVQLSSKCVDVTKLTIRAFNWSLCDECDEGSLSQ